MGEELANKIYINRNYQIQRTENIYKNDYVIDYYLGLYHTVCIHMSSRKTMKRK